MRFSEGVLKKIFEKSFDDTVTNSYSIRSWIYVDGEKYLMGYNFLDGCIIFTESGGTRIGTIFLYNGSDMFFETNPLSPIGCYVALFLSELKRSIESNKRRTRRKFIAR